MPLTPVQEKALIEELVEVIERFHAAVNVDSESYEANVSQPYPECLVIRLFPVSAKKSS
ncbi:hypothetical protein [Vreelandella venusta]|uniref:hypothetical protein n=1 Tax=Vreelandella venusta TaxID=44935 RepID=UPI00384AB544